jgi:hypothetical protein
MNGVLCYFRRWGYFHVRKVGETLLWREIIAICSEILAKHIGLNALRGRNVEFFYV